MSNITLDDVNACVWVNYAEIDRVVEPVLSEGVSMNVERRRSLRALCGPPPGFDWGTGNSGCVRSAKVSTCKVVTLADYFSACWFETD